MTPLISVIIPTYNHRDYILATLNSVFAQTFTDYEVIVVNDGSPDDTAAVLAPYVEAGRITYIEQPNAGQGAARNRGLSQATGEFIAFLDDDDRWPPDKLNWQVNAARANPAAVLIYGYAKVFGEEFPATIYPSRDAPTGDVFSRFLDCAWTCSPGQTLIRRDAIQKVGGFDPTVPGADDWDLYLKLARLGAFHYVHESALCYRVHATNASSRVLNHYHSATKVRRRHLAVARQLGIDLANIQTPGEFAAGFREQARRLLRGAKGRGDWFGRIRYTASIPLIDPLDYFVRGLKRTARRVLAGS